MTSGEKKPGDLSALMATVAAIVEAVLEGEALTPLTQRPSPWKAAHREEIAREQRWRDIGWNRA